MKTFHINVEIFKIKSFLWDFLKETANIELIDNAS